MPKPTNPDMEGADDDEPESTKSDDIEPTREEARLGPGASLLRPPMLSRQTRDGKGALQDEQQASSSSCYTPRWTFDNSKTFDSEWEIPTVLEKIRRFSPVASQKANTDGEWVSSAMANLVTVTLLSYRESKSESLFVCLTCKEFLDRFFPERGPVALRLLSVAAKRSLWGIHQAALQPEEADYSTYLPKTVVSHERLLLSLKEPWGTDAALKGALLWMISAIRLPPAGDDGDSFKFSEMVESIPWGIWKSYQFRERPFAPLTEAAPDAASFCWLKLFKACLITFWPNPEPSTYLYPRTGLEIPFDLMCSLAAVESACVIDDGLILLGFFTALIPIYYDEDLGEIMWHIETVGMNGKSPKSLIDPKALESLKWFRTQDLSLLKASTCRIGFTEQALVMLGTERLLKNQTYQPGLSRNLKQRKRRLEHSGVEGGGQMGIDTGVFNLGIQAKSVYEFVSVVPAFRGPQSFHQSLVFGRNKMVCIFDNATQQAWIVPYLSVILHLCQIYAQKSRQVARSEEAWPIPFARPDADGQQAVLEALVDRGDSYIDGNEQRGGMMLRTLWHGIDLNFREAARGEIACHSKNVYAVELLDIVFNPLKESAVKEIPIPPAKYGKTVASVLHEVDAICVVENLGPAIEPGTGLPCKYCRSPDENSENSPLHDRSLYATQECVKLLESRRCTRTAHLFCSSCGLFRAFVA